MNGKVESQLHRAAREGKLEDLKRLVTDGNVDLESEDDFQTSLYCACAAGHADVVQFLLDAGARITGAKIPRFQYDEDLVITPDRESDDTSDDEHEYWYWDPVLLAACSHGHTAVVKILLEKGAPLNDYYEDSPLHTACRREEADDDLIRLLLSFGACVNVRDGDGNTPLFSAVNNGHAGIAKLLINSGAHVNAMNYENDTPLHVAVKWSHLAAAMVLLEHGADVHALNEHGENPLQVQYYLPLPCIITLLLDYDAGEVQCCKTGCCCGTSVMRCSYSHGRYIQSSGHFAGFSELNFDSQLEAFETYWSKMKVAGLMPVDDEGEENLMAADTFCQECKTELDRMTTETVSDTNVSYKNIWNQRPAALRKVESLELDEIIHKFPIYFGQIRRRYVAAHQRLFFLDQATGFFSYLPLPSLLPECVDEIMSYLSKEDLKNLVTMKNCY